jgi:uncharacterized protein YhjY with autotransporter beta-barrel domain
MQWRRLLGTVAIVAAVPAVATAQVIIDNGTVQLGINPAGNLITDGIGLTFIPSLTNPEAENRGEALAPGCDCEGWGLGDLTTGSYGMAGQSFGFRGINTSSVTASGTGTQPASVGSGAVSVTNVVDAELDVLLTHTYAPSTSDNLYSVTIDILNQGAGDIGNLIFRRAMDWDIPPDEFNEFVTLQGWPATALVGSSNDGFVDGNINDPLTVISGAGAVANGNFTNAGPDDHGAAFDFSFGTLAVGETQTLTIFYGAAASEADALMALGEVGAEVYSLGKVGSDAGRDAGTPHTFIFGFAGVGGTPVGPGAAVIPINQFPQIAEVFVNRARDNASSIMSDAGFADMLAGAGLTTSPEVDRGRRTLNFHIAAHGSAGEFKGTPNNILVDYRASGLAFAVDTRMTTGISGLERGLVGAQLGTTFANAGLGGAFGRLDAQSLDLVLYGRLSGSSNAFVEGLIHLGRHDYEQDRFGLTATFTSEPEGRSVGALVRGGYTFRLGATEGGATNLSLYGELATNRTKIDTFTENNNGISVASYSDRQSHGGLGMRFEAAQRMGDAVGFARLDIAGLFEFGDDGYSTELTTAGGATMTANADAVDGALLRVRGTLGAVQGDRYTTSIEYSGLLGEGGEVQDHRLTVRYKLEF